MTHFLKDSLFTLLRIMRPGLGKSASILMYHSVGEGGAFFAVTKEDFEEQLHYLVSRKVTFLKLSELVRRLEAKESIANCVCLTLDDGYKDNYINVYPLLVEHTIPMTIFITTGTLGGTLTLEKSRASFPMLALSEVQEMHASGLVEFLPHSVTHVRYRVKNLDACVAEARQSKEFLEKLFGESITIYAYPSGAYDASVISALKKIGYTAAVTVQEGLVHSGDDLFTLKRNAVDSLTTLPQFKGKVARSVEWYVALKNVFSFLRK